MSPRGIPADLLASAPGGSEADEHLVARQSTELAAERLPDSLLSVRAVGASLGVSTATVYALAHSGELPFIRIRGAIRFRPQDLEAYRRR